MLQLDVVVSSALKRRIETADALKEEIKSIPINTFTEKRMYRRTLVSSGLFALALEGIRIYKDEAEDILIHNAKPLGEKQHALKSYTNVIEYICSYYDTQSLSLQRETVKKIHEHILDYGNNAYVNKYFRDYPFGSDTYIPCRPEKIPQEIDNLCTFLEKDQTHPLLKAGIFYINFVRISPFQKANIRSALALTLLYLYQSGYACSGFYTYERYLYFPNGKKYTELTTRFLGNKYDSDVQILPFLLFFIESIQEGLLHILQYLKNPLLLDENEDYMLLTSDQKEILLYIEKQKEIRLQEYHKLYPQKSMAIMKRNIALLKDIGFLMKKGLGKSTYYILRSPLSH